MKAWKVRPEVSRLLIFALALMATLVMALWPQDSGQTFRTLVSNGISYQQGTVAEVISETLEESALNSGQLGRQELDILLKDGRHIQLTNYLTDTHNILAKEGNRVIVCVDAPEGVEPYYTLYNYDRGAVLGGLLAVFVLLMLWVGGGRGGCAVLALLFSLLFLVRVTVPAIYEGSSPVGVGILMVLLSTAVTLLLLHGPTARAALAAGVTLAGECVAGVLFAAASALLHISGFQTDAAEGLLVVAQNTELDLKNLLFAAVMIASLGAVMDVAVSLLSALWELRVNQPVISARQLFRSGMNIGRDMIGTMSNTLIFAFAGNALTTMLSLYAYGIQTNQLLHSDYVALELAQGLCGTCAVILTVPMASLAAAMAFPHWKIPVENTVCIEHSKQGKNFKGVTT